MAQVRATEGRHAEALVLLERIQEAHLARPGLLLQTARLFIKLRRWQEAEQTYARALSIDPDNPQGDTKVWSRLGSASSRARFPRRRPGRPRCPAARHSHHGPMQAHFLLGTALTGLQQLARAAEAFRTALSLNPNFPEAHLRLARVLQGLGDGAAAADHLRFFHELRSRAESVPIPRFARRAAD